LTELLETQSHFAGGRMRGTTVEWTNEGTEELRKWHPRSTLLFVVATSGAFWAVLIWSLIHWI